MFKGQRRWRRTVSGPLRPQPYSPVEEAELVLFEELLGQVMRINVPIDRDRREATKRAMLQAFADSGNQGRTQQKRDAQS